jgi:hypothetical protein
LTYSDGDAVVIRVRKRAHRYDIDDDGAAVAKARAAGTTRRWLEVALKRRVAATSRAVESELLAVED